MGEYDKRISLWNVSPNEVLYIIINDNCSFVKFWLIYMLPETMVYK